METVEAAKKRSRKSEAIRLVFFAVFIFIVAGISSVLFDKYVLPRLAAHAWFGKQPFFKQAMDNVTIINKTEQVTVSESQNISGYTQKSASSVVEIVSRQRGVKTGLPAAQESASGVIVASDGLVAGFGDKFFDGKDAEYKVFLPDGKSYAARVAVVDPFSNIVLLKLDGAENLPVAEFIAPEDIKTGMKTVLIGRSGFNSEISLKMGITGAWAKSYSLSGPIASSEKMQGVLLADFPGMENAESKTLAGGAVTDQNGNMIGILGERKRDAADEYFVIPVNHLKYVIDRYLEKGEIERASLGVYYMALSRETAFLAGNNFERGAMVYSPSGQQGLAVIAGSAADKADIRIGDVILSAGGDEVTPDQNLAYLISKHKPGDTVSLRINRGGEEMEVKAVLQ